MFQKRNVRRLLCSLRRDESGTVAIIVCFMFIILIGFAALAIDGGQLYLKRLRP